MKITELNPNYFLMALKHISLSFNSFSIVNNEGQLLYSKDLTTQFLTTTRLVAFQIIKKYLNPQPHDLFILNDPENGGFNLTQIIFVAPLSENLFVIWDEELSVIDFKIPPTPIYEKNKENQFVWKALVESHPQSKTLTAFFQNAKKQIDLLFTEKEKIIYLNSVKNQTSWLKASQEMFEYQFSNKALGSSESSFKFKNKQLLKLKLSIEEKQNLKLLTLDFTNTSIATDYYAASHVVESGLIQKIIHFYQIEDYFSQAILDKIKIILPPKSIISKSHPTGEYNLELQSICSHLCGYNLNNLNLKTNKIAAHFEMPAELSFDFIFQSKNFSFYFDQKNINIESLQNLLNQGFASLQTLSRLDSIIKIKLQVLTNEALTIKIKSNLIEDQKEYSICVNQKQNMNRLTHLKKDDLIEIEWKLT